MNYKQHAAIRGAIAGICISVLAYTFWPEPKPKPGQVWVFHGDDPFKPVLEENTVIDVKGGYVLFKKIMPLGDGTYATNLDSSSISWFLVGSRLKQTTQPKQ